MPAAEPKVRVCWGLVGPLDAAYHDNEWGVPCHDDRELFERLLLEGFQAGLSWSTILAKRENFARAFDGWDADRIAGYGEEDIARLMADPGIVRNRLKVNAAVKNARGFLDVQREHGTFDRYIWSFAPAADHRVAPPTFGEVPASTVDSDAMSKALKKRGFTFVGSTICYAFMQSVGMVNDHLGDCPAGVALRKRQPIGLLILWPLLWAAPTTRSRRCHPSTPTSPAKIDELLAKQVAGRYADRRAGGRVQGRQARRRYLRGDDGTRRPAVDPAGQPGLRILRDEGPGGVRCAHPRRPGNARVRPASGEVLAGVRAERQGQSDRGAGIEPPGWTARDAAAVQSGAPDGLGRRHQANGGGRARLRTGNIDRVPRGDIRLGRGRHRKGCLGASHQGRDDGGGDEAAGDRRTRSTSASRTASRSG